MKKKLLALALLLGLTVTTTAMGVFTATAAVKENTVADNVITDSGIVNELDWRLVGSEAAFEANVMGDILEAKDVVWGTGWLVPFDTATFAEGSVTLSYDKYFMKGCTITPYIVPGDKLYTNQLNKIVFGGPDNGMANGSEDPHAATIEYYADEALTTKHAGDIGSGICWQVIFGLNPGEMNFHVEYIFKADGVMGAKTYALNADGTYNAATPYEQLWIKNGYEVDTTSAYRFGLAYYGSLTIDNLKISTPSKTVFYTDFSGTEWNNKTEAPKPGTVFNLGGNPVKLSSIDANFTSADRMVTELKVKTDSNTAKAFTLSGAIDFKEIGEFGMAIGLDSQDQAFNADGVSYVYFTHAEGVTYLNVMENGTAVGDPIALGDMVTGGFVDLDLSANMDGSASLTTPAGTVNFTLSPENYNGYFAMGTTGENTASVAINCDVNLISYAYRGSEGEAIASNFNTNWINPEKWEMICGTPVMFEDPAETNGILAEDGKLKFAGTGHGSYVGTTERYSEYVVEFVVEEFFDGDKPALLDSYELGYSALTMIIGVDTATAAPSGWAEKTMITFYEGYMQLLDFKQPQLVIESVLTNYNFRPTEAGKTKSTAVKMVVLNNSVAIYLQELVEGVAPTEEAWVEAAKFQTAETFGKVNFATTEAAVFNLDDIRITPIDDPDPEKVVANAAAYQSFQAIADENRPFTLATPVLTMTETVISWEAVADAAGYIINVNGKQTEVGADVLSYDVADAEPGDYIVTVVAKGNGEWISDSAQSTAIEFTIEAVEEPQEEPKKGCYGGISTTSAMAVLAVAGAIFAAKKRKED